MRQRLATILRRFPTTYWVLFAVMLLSRAGSLALPFLMLFLGEQRGLSLSTAGFALSSYGAGAVGAAAVGGMLADAWGRRPTVLLSMFGGAVCVLALGAVEDTEVIFAACLSFGFFAELHRPASSASITDVVVPHDRSVAFAYLYWAHNLGFAIAPAVGGLLIAGFDLYAVFAGNALSLLLCGLLALRLLPETKPTQVAAVTRDRGGAWALLGVLRDARLSLFLLAFLPIPMLLLQLLTVLPVLASADGIDAVAYGRILSLNGVLIVVLQPWVIGRLAPLRQSWVLAAGALLVGVGFSGHALADSPLQHMLTLSLWTLGEIAVVPMAAGLVASLAPEDRRGQYQGAYGMTWSLAFLAAPFVATRVLSGIGSSGWGIACACAGAFSALNYVAFGLYRRSEAS